MSKTESIRSRRPLSPHLGIYKIQITSTLSILHRLTGFALFCGTLFFSWWLIMGVFSECSFSCVRKMLFEHIIGKLVLLGWVFSLFYHFFNGIRHLVWDAGFGFKLKTVSFTGMLVVLLSVITTAICWLIAF